MSSNHPSEECVSAAELLINTHQNGVVIYESDKGGIVVVVTNPSSQEMMMLMIESIEKFQSAINPEKSVDENVAANLFGKNPDVPEA
tara:strand:+ start:532 stop:792 length:261 start_codon:yes stop_codon:yes gene_type:complete